MIRELGAMTDITKQCIKKSMSFQGSEVNHLKKHNVACETESDVFCDIAMHWASVVSYAGGMLHVC